MKAFSSLVPFIPLLALLTISSKAVAQPWMATRSAQNCAACHSPGRLNRPISERRCTLSCQGCHVNPNGGGIRNFYGVWNQQRWLRSFYVDSLPTNRRTPAPFKFQQYATKKSGVAIKGQSSTGPFASDKPTHRVSLLVPAEKDSMDERLYDRSDGQEQIEARSEGEFLEHVAAEDPYRQERNSVLSGGLSFRYLTTFPLSQSGPQSRQFNNTFQSWPMALDIGVRLKPLPEHLSLVVESRFLNPPANRIWDQLVTTENRIQSIYALSDGWAYNSYAMYGLYRPMFGLYNPDHDSLSNVISGLNHRSVYKVVGIGSAPNVPFFNVNYLTPINSTSYDQQKGFAVNVGARWVTLGASVVLSYWGLSSEASGTKLKNNLYALTTGMSWQGLIWNIELLYRSREFAPGSSDGGTVLTSQMKYRVWRENYVKVNAAISGVSMNLTEGASNEVIVGVQSFPITGTEVELLYNYRNNRTPLLTQNVSQVQLMGHLFF